MKRRACPGCGATVLTGETASAPGGTASATCAAAFGELLATSYSDPSRRSSHQVLVDSYITQHGGGRADREIQAVAICLMTLHLFIEHGVDPREGPTLHRKMVDSGVAFDFLTPPKFLEDHPNVISVSQSLVPQEAIWEWALSTWSHWEPHHVRIRSWTQASLR